MPHTAYGLFSYAAMLIMSGVALWRGSNAVRAAAGVLLIGTFLFPLVQDRVHWSNWLTPLLAIDLFELVWLVLIASLVGGPWLILAAAFQVLDVATEFSHIYVTGVVEAYVYISLLQVWSWGLYLSVLGGALAPGWLRRRAPET